MDNEALIRPRSLAAVVVRRGGGRSALSVASAGPASRTSPTGSTMSPHDAFLLGGGDGTACSKTACSRAPSAMMTAAGFCPDEPIDRKTMAVWIGAGARRRGIRSRWPKPGSTTWAIPASMRGSSSACTDLERDQRAAATEAGFCPDRTVTRARDGRVLVACLPAARRHRTPASAMLPPMRMVRRGCGQSGRFGRHQRDAAMAATVLSGSGPHDPRPDGRRSCTGPRTAAGGSSIEGETPTTAATSSSEPRQDQTEVPWRPKGLALVGALHLLGRRVRAPLHRSST